MKRNVMDEPESYRSPSASTRRVGRRELLAGGMAAIGAGLTDAWAIEPYRLDVSRHDVLVSGLPGALDGLRIAQVSDIHLPATPAAAEHAARAVERERPEIVVITGDIIEHASALPQLTEFASRVRGTLDTLAVLGNWEHRAGVSSAAASAAYAAAGVTFLNNASVLVPRRGAALRITGFDDPVLGAPDPARALAHDGGVEIWLIHAPAYLDTLPMTTRKPAFILCGHTHGGQIRLPGITLVTPPGSGRYVSGWYVDGLAPTYVTRGIGTASIRARLFCPPELPIFTLRRA